MVHLDENSGVIEWSSEEIIIPYLSPVDNKWHRYFPDFFARIKNKDGKLEGVLLEVKPHSQTAPPKVAKRVTKRVIQEVMAYGINEAKWNAASEYCKDKGWIFRVITEKDIFKS